MARRSNWMTPPEFGPGSEGRFIGRLPADLVVALRRAGQIVEYPTGSVTFRPDDGERAGIVVAGLLRVFLAGPDGRQITLRYARSGDIVGVPIRDKPVGSGVQTMAPTRLLELDAGQLRGLAEREPRLALALLDEATERLVATCRVLSLRAFGRVSTRVAQDIL